MAADGSVIFSVELDDKEAQRELQRIKDKIIAMENEKNVRADQKNALSEQLSVTAAQADAAKARLEELRAEKERLNNLTPYDGEEFLTAEQQLEKVNEKIKEAEKEVQNWDKEVARVDNTILKHEEHLRDIEAAIHAEKEAYAEVETKAQEAARAAEEKRRAEQAAREAQKEAEAAAKEFEAAHRQLEFEIMRASAEKADSSVAALNQELARLRERQREMEAAGMGLGYKEYDDTLKRIEEINQEMKEYRKNLIKAGSEEGRLTDGAREAEEVIRRMPPEGKALSAAMEEAAKRINKIQNKLSGMLKRVFVFTVITKALREVREYLSESIQISTEAQAAIAKLKAALLTLAQPLIDVLIPALTQFVELLSKVAATAAKIVSKLFGQNLETTVEQAEASKKARDALGEEAKAIKDTGDAAEEAEKQLADFDEIQKLTADNSKDAKKDDDLSDDLSKSDNAAPDFASVVSNQLSAIAELLTGIALVALGCILVFSGAAILVGIAMIIVGALMIWDAVTDNPEAIKQWIKEHSEQIAGVLLAVAAVAIIIGIILVVAGQVAVGVALIVLGIAAFVAAYEMDPDAVKTFITDHMDTIAEALLIIGTVAIVVGVILLLAGQILIGVALIVIGITMVVAAYQMDPEGLTKFIEDNMDTIVEVLLVIAAVAVVVGVIVVLSGNILVGIALIVIGIAAFVAAYEMNPDAVTQFIQEHMETITTVLLIIAAVAVVTGIILLIAGQFLVGIALIVIGIAAFVAAYEMNPDGVTQFIQQHADIIAGVLVAIAAICFVAGIIMLFTHQYLIGITLLIIGVAAYYEATELQPDVLENMVGDNMEKIAAVVGAISAALFVLGIVLLFTAANIPLGIGLILAGIAGMAFAEEHDPDWDWLKSKLDDVWKSISDAAKSAWDSIKKQLEDIWKKICDEAKKSWDGLKDLMASTWDKIKKDVEEKWNNIVNAIKNKVEEAIKKIKELLGLQSQADGSSFGGRGGFSGGSATAGISTSSVPGLARGAVIPPNREFLAVLGDQRYGNNIEAPEAALQAMADRAASANTDLLRQILRAVQAGKTIECDGITFGQVVYNLNNAESARAGASLVEVT